MILVLKEPPPGVLVVSMFVALVTLDSEINFGIRKEKSNYEATVVGALWSKGILDWLLVGQGDKRN
jgi:hypothetical protein